MKNIEIQEPKLSVIIPVHNKADTLPRLLEALKLQQPTNFIYEVIFIADACSDKSLSILQLAQSEQSFQLIQTNSNKCGASAARNLGIEKARGLYCLFLDGDIVVPKDFLFTVIRYLEEFPDAVYSAPVYGNAGSLSTWPLLVQSHRSVQTLSNCELLDWARMQKPLEDLRVAFVKNFDGWFDHLSAPWVFAWSSAIALKRELLLKVNGFNTSFKGKGSEDLELGYRLHKLNIRFRMMLDTYVFHLPHTRNRDREEQTDRLQERQMLQTHPISEMEALCAFDGSHTNAMIQCLQVINKEVVDNIQNFWKMYIDIKKLALPDKIPLVIGTVPDWMTHAWASTCVVKPCADLDDYHLPLMGLALPFEDKAFASAVVVGLWQILPERIACRIFDEAIRVAEIVYVLKNTHMPVEVISWPQDTLTIHDAPYWERTHAIHRSFFDFTVTEFGSDGCIESYQIRLNNHTY